jgi:hypothetical protein
MNLIRRFSLLVRVPSLFLSRPLQQIGQSVEPGVVALTSGCSELDSSTGCDDDETLAMEPRRIGIIVRDNLDGLDSYALRFELSSTG